MFSNVSTYEIVDKIFWRSPDAPIYSKCFLVQILSISSSPGLDDVTELFIYRWDAKVEAQSERLGSDVSENKDPGRLSPRVRVQTLEIFSANKNLQNSAETRVQRKCFGERSVYPSERGQSSRAPRDRGSPTPPFHLHGDGRLLKNGRGSRVSNGRKIIRKKGRKTWNGYNTK